MNDTREYGFSIRNSVLRAFTVRRDDGQIIFRVKKTRTGLSGDTNGLAVFDAMGRPVASADYFVRVQASQDPTSGAPLAQDRVEHEEDSGHFVGTQTGLRGLKGLLLRRFDRLAAHLMGRVGVEIRNGEGDKIGVVSVTSLEPAGFRLVWESAEYLYSVPMEGKNNVFRHRTIITVDGQEIAQVRSSIVRWSRFSVELCGAQRLLPVVMLCLGVHLLTLSEGFTGGVG